MPARCIRCGKRTGETGAGRAVCRACAYVTLEPLLAERDRPAAPAGERYANLVEVAPYWAVARYLGGLNPRIVRRQARLYTSQQARLREAEIARPDREYQRRCGHCGRIGHVATTCPELHPDRDR